MKIKNAHGKQVNNKKPACNSCGNYADALLSLVKKAKLRKKLVIV